MKTKSCDAGAGEGLSWNRFIKSPRDQAPESGSEFMSLRVYDLYSKKPATSAKAWWQDRDSDMRGKVTLPLYSDI